jgi:gluconokinase
MIIILMGPAGVGKTTVGRALASAIGWPFRDADDLHPPANIEKLRRGVPLDEADRQPWLARVREVIVDASERKADVVLACSALREAYRQYLREGVDVDVIRWVFLYADRDLLHRRLASRQGHFAGPALLDSQLADLEPPADAPVVATSRPVADAVTEIRNTLGLPERPRL